MVVVLGLDPCLIGTFHCKTASSVGLSGMNAPELEQSVADSGQWVGIVTL